MLGFRVGAARCAAVQQRQAVFRGELTMLAARVLQAVFLCPPVQAGLVPRVEPRFASRSGLGFGLAGQLLARETERQPQLVSALEQTDSVREQELGVASHAVETLWRAAPEALQLELAPLVSDLELLAAFPDAW